MRFLLLACGAPIVGLLALGDPSTASVEDMTRSFALGGAYLLACVFVAAAMHPKGKGGGT